MQPLRKDLLGKVAQDAAMPCCRPLHRTTFFSFYYSAARNAFFQKQVSRPSGIPSLLKGESWPWHTVCVVLRLIVPSSSQRHRPGDSSGAKGARRAEAPHLFEECLALFMPSGRARVNWVKEDSGPAEAALRFPEPRRGRPGWLARVAR